MNAKLTLNVNKDIANKAKLYARSKGRSLSDLVEDYFKLLTRDMLFTEKEISPKVKNILGSINVPEDFDYKKDLADQLSKKYLKEYLNSPPEFTVLAIANYGSISWC